MVSPLPLTQAVPAAGPRAGNVRKPHSLGSRRFPGNRRRPAASRNLDIGAARVERDRRIETYDHPPVFRVFLLLLAFLIAAPAAHAGSRTTEGGHVVRWDDGLGGLGERVHDLLPSVRRQVAERIGFPFSGGPAEVVIVSGLDRIRAEAGASVPDWAAGVCVSSRSRIILRSDRLRDSGPIRAWPSTLRHEWVHLAWGRRAGANKRRLPLWAEEGLAEEIGGGISLEGGARLDFAAKWSGLIPMEDIRAQWPADASEAALAYRQGRSFIQYFVRKRGWDDLRAILSDLADGKGASVSPAAGPHFDELVYRQTGTSLSKWQAEWTIHLEETADPLFYLLLRDLTGTIFFVIALTGLVAFWFLRRRRRRQIAALPDDPDPIAEGLG